MDRETLLRFARVEERQENLIERVRFLEERPEPEHDDGPTATTIVALITTTGLVIAAAITALAQILSAAPTP